MTIIAPSSATAHGGTTRSPERTSTPADRITQPGTAPRVPRPATPSRTSAAPSITDMDQLHIPGIDTPVQGTLALDVPERPWVYDQALSMAEQGRVWRDHRRNIWERVSDTDARLVTSTSLLRALGELCASWYIGLPSSSTTTITVSPLRGGLRMRRYTLTESGAQLHSDWARLRDY